MNIIQDGLQARGIKNMSYVFPWLYYDDITELNHFDFSSNATGTTIQDVISELYNTDSIILHTWWIVPVIVIIVLILNTYTFKY